MGPESSSAASLAGSQHLAASPAKGWERELGALPLHAESGAGVAESGAIYSRRSCCSLPWAPWTV